MPKISTSNVRCTAEKNLRLPVKALARIASTNLSTPTRLLSQISAAGLVLASAGLGAIYAGTTGSQHGFGLASLMVLMAVALEVAKPLSLASAFGAFRSWAVVRGALLTVLALVAISYSLTAELTLMAGARGDVVAKREAALKANASADTEAQRLRDRYGAAKAELATLPATRPAAELQSEIDGLLLTPGADNCAAINGRVTKTVCPRVAELRTEKARAERRAELETTVAQPLSAVANIAPQVSAADPGATALHTYFLALGFTIPAHALTEWLALIPVLALEIGSALAGILVQATSASAPRSRSKVVTAEPETETVVQVVHPINTDDAATREKVKTAIMAQLEQRGGSLAKSERGIAALIGASRPTVRRAINGLVLAGLVAAEASRNGTMLRLIS